MFCCIDVFSLPLPFSRFSTSSIGKAHGSKLVGGWDGGERHVLGCVNCPCAARVLPASVPPRHRSEALASFSPAARTMPLLPPRCGRSTEGFETRSRSGTSLGNPMWMFERPRRIGSGSSGGGSVLTCRCGIRPSAGKTRGPINDFQRRQEGMLQRSLQAQQRHQLHQQQQRQLQQQMRQQQLQEQQRQQQQQQQQQLQQQQLRQQMQQQQLQLQQSAQQQLQQQEPDIVSL